MSKGNDPNAAIALTNLGRTIDSIARLVAKGRDVVEGDQFLPYAAQWLGIRLGQDVARLPEDWREQYPGVPWRNLRALGSRIEHHPRDVDLAILRDVFAVEIPAVRRVVWADIEVSRGIARTGEPGQGEGGGPVTTL